ncbi:hypothetical protein GCM10026983_28490 [Gracilibacillus alcaliphilus]
MGDLTGFLLTCVIFAISYQQILDASLSLWFMQMVVAFVDLWKIVKQQIEMILEVSNGYI